MFQGLGFVFKKKRFWIDGLGFRVRIKKRFRIDGLGFEFRNSIIRKN